MRWTLEIFSLIDLVTEEKFIYCNQYYFMLHLNQKLLSVVNSN